MVVDRTALEGNPKAAREWRLFHEQVSILPSRDSMASNRVSVWGET
jgi:hypothetical protein